MRRQGRGPRQQEVAKEEEAATTCRPRAVLEAAEKLDDDFSKEDDEREGSCDYLHEQFWSQRQRLRPPTYQGSSGT